MEKKEKELVIEVEIGSAEGEAPEKVIDIALKRVERFSFTFEKNEGKKEIVIEIEEAS